MTNKKIKVACSYCGSGFDLNADLEKIIEKYSRVKFVCLSCEFKQVVEKEGYANE